MRDEDNVVVPAVIEPLDSLAYLLIAQREACGTNPVTATVSRIASDSSAALGGRTRIPIPRNHGLADDERPQVPRLIDRTCIDLVATTGIDEAIRLNHPLGDAGLPGA